MLQPALTHVKIMFLILSYDLYFTYHEFLRPARYFPTLYIFVNPKYFVTKSRMFQETGKLTYLINNDLVQRQIKTFIFG